jgi:DNA-binding SARP family transcriptional activator
VVPDAAVPVSRRVAVRLLGPVEVLVDGRSVPAGGRRQRTVLALLAIRAGRVVSVDELADAVWADEAVDRSRATLQVYASNLRKVLDPAGPAVIESRSGGYVLDPAKVEVDVDMFEADLDRAAAAAADDDHDAVVRLLRAALALWRGEVVADLVEVDAFEADRARLGERHAGAIEMLYESELVRGRHTDIVAELTVAVTEHPLRERLRAQLMLALYRSGRQAEALRAYQDARRVLGDELGLDPGPGLQRLERSILAQSESIAAPSPPQPALVWLAPDGQGRRLDLSGAGGSISIGRQDDCDVALAWDGKVSRRHAEVHRDGHGWRLSDDGLSQNGTFRNGERITEAHLADGDLLRFGDTSVLVRLPSAAPPSMRLPVIGETILADED